jgi:hypothetical protein
VTISKILDHCKTKPFDKHQFKYKFVIQHFMYNKNDVYK